MSTEFPRRSMPHTGLLLRRIERESVEGNWEVVLRLLGRVEPLVNPNSSSEREFLLYHRGYALLELNREAEAVGALRELVEIDGATAHYRLLLADSLIRVEAWQEAFRQLEAGLACEPAHPGCLCALGWALYQVGDKKAGKAFLAHAAELHPDYYPAHLDLGLIHAAEGRWEASEAALEAALEAAPDDQEIRDALEAVRENRDTAEAQKACVRELWPRIRRQRAALAADEARMLREVRKRLFTKGISHLGILLVELLWADYARTRARKPKPGPSWGATLLYACEWLNGTRPCRNDVAREWGVSRFGVARRFRRLTQTMNLETCDARYSVHAHCAGRPRAVRRRNRVGSDEPRRPLASIIPVDFVCRRRLRAAPELPPP